MRSDKESFAGESGVTENPLAALLKQKTYGCTKRLSGTTPLPGLLRPRKRSSAKAQKAYVEIWEADIRFLFR